MRVRSISVLCILILAVTEQVRADGPVAKMPWLHEGLLLTYSWYSAVAPGNGSDYSEDPNGDWINSATGQRYSRTVQQGTSGTGFNEATVAAIDGDKAVIAVQLFGNAGQLGNNVPVPLQGGSNFIAPVDQAGDLWMSPDKLAALHTDANTGLLVTSVPWKTDGGMINAIRVQSVSGGGYALHIFDPKTGLCLHVATAQRGTAPKNVGPGDFGQGDVSLNETDFVGKRDLVVPWANQAMPDWVGGIKALHYGGSIISRGPLPMPPNQVTMDLTANSHGLNWAQMDCVSQVVMQGAPQSAATKSEVFFGRAQFAGLWANAASLANLQQGQVLDDDPITKMKTTVTQINGNAVTIAQQNAGGEIDNQYDKTTGLLIGSSYFSVLSLQQISVQLNSRE
jgi:hypothetical protein